LADIQAKTKKWNLDRDIKFNHKVTGLVWVEDRSQWKVTVQPAGGQQFIDWADVLVSARGFLHDWNWPSIKNLHSFQGKLVHSAAWDHAFDFGNKKIAVIGNGSSAVQILPEMANLEGTSVVNFIHGPAWVFAGLPPAALVGGNDPSFNPVYSEADVDKFQNNPELFLEYRKKIQNSYSRVFHMVRSRTPISCLLAC
jgi:cation diffusion facilitator CzcD-associated flavoprotein CzcO